MLHVFRPVFLLTGVVTVTRVPATVKLGLVPTVGALKQRKRGCDKEAETKLPPLHRHLEIHLIQASKFQIE